MATMYPNRFPDDSKSSGERKVYEYLKSQTPKEWCAIHSYMLPEHSKVVFGEADFIVIGPEIGVVILEIKSGGVGFNGSEWLFRDRKGNISKKYRGPFAQARDAMFEIEKIISTHLTEDFDKYNVLYNYCVIFTDEDSFPINKFPEWEPWRLHQNDGKNDYCKFLHELTENYKKELTVLGKHLPNDIDVAAVKSIAETLRPSVECVVPLKMFLQASEEDIIQLTEEQFHCLDDIEENKRILITGGAGTGKTLIAVETAKYMASAGKKVLFLCFNSNLAFYLKSLMHIPNVDVYGLHKYLMSLYKGEVPETDYLSDFFANDLPQSCKKLISQKFDYLIIDEFQDLCTKPYLDFLNEVLNNGLQNGSFAFFADFSRQAIYNPNSCFEYLEARTFYAKKRLSINCRNTENIGNELINITGYKDNKYRLSIPGEKVDYIVWDSKKQQAEKLRTLIKTLNKLRVPSDQIVILSPIVRNKSIVNYIDEDEDFITNYENQSLDGYFGIFSTIHAFKGLESRIVIICDVDNYENKNLLYIGMSRARSKLFIFESADANKQRIELMARRN